MTKLILDTDIGTDVDDALALVYAVKSGMEVKLITTVHGDTVLRAKIAKKLSALLGADIPVAAGERKPIKQTHIYWTGHERKGFVDEGGNYDVRSNGVEALVESVQQYAHDVNLACLGPLTNIANAFQRAPELPTKISHLYIMGNAILCGDTFHLNYRAHNFKVDPEAADIVMEADVPKTIITTSVCKKNALSKAELERFAESGNPVGTYLRDAGLAYLAYMGYEQAYLYDPLVVDHHLHSSTELREYGTVRITTDVRPDFRERFISRLLEDSKDKV